LCTRGRQIDAQPAGAGSDGTVALRQDRLRCGKIEGLLVDLLRDAQAAVAAPIILDLDAPGDPLQGHQEERFFHGDYDNYCYRPLDVFCGRVFCGRHLLAAKLRPANIHARTGRVEEVSRIVTPIRRRGPAVGILLRAEAGFARDGLMSWCENRRENNGADFLFGLARNRRLVGAIEAALAAAQEQSQKTGKPARRFQDFTWRRDSGSRERRVVAKAEWTQGAANPRFVHLAEPRGARGPPPLREALLHPRREGKLHQENRADRRVSFKPPDAAARNRFWPVAIQSNRAETIAAASLHVPA
jgi:hypothetical protein